jgi:hypothetical protein
LHLPSHPSPKMRVQLVQSAQTKFCFFRMYFLNTKLLFEYGIPRPTQTRASRCGNTFATAIFLPVYNLNCSALKRVTEKSHLFHTNCRSSRARGSNPGHLRGRQQRKPLSHPLRLRHRVTGSSHIRMYLYNDISDLSVNQNQAAVRALAVSAGHPLQMVNWRANPISESDNLDEDELWRQKSKCLFHLISFTLEFPPLQI